MITSAKKILANALLAMFALVCSLAVGEIVVRSLYKSETVLFPRYHTDYQYGRYTIRGIRPNAEFWHTSIDGTWRFVTNNKGFRNIKDFAYAKPANTIRVLSLGDSQTQGYEVHQDLTFSAVLERFLKAHNANAEVINTGVSGFSTAEELVFLENEGIKYNPDVVLLGFFANDFDDNLKTGLFGLDTQNRLIEIKYKYTPGVFIQNVIYSIPGVKWLSENSYFYSLLFNSVWRYFKVRLTKQAIEKANAKDESRAGGADAFEYAVPTNRAPSEYQITLTAKLIERMQQFCRDHKIRFILIDIPTCLRGPYHYDSSLPPALLKTLSAAHVEYISSKSVLQNFDGAAQFCAPHGDHHISEFTHTLIGMEIGRRLLESGTGAGK